MTQQKVNWSGLPVAMPGGSLLPHMSARHRSQVFDTAFEMLGGVDRLVAWAEASDDNYKEFLRLYGRGQARASTTELTTATVSVEELLAQLDAGEHAKVVGGDS